MKTETKEIKKVTIGAVSIKKTKKDGTPYTWKDKKRGDAVTPRTMVSIKVDEEWLMGWSYKDGSAAESLKTGDVVELLVITEVGDDQKVWKSWKFPKPEDKTEMENLELKRKLAAFEAAQSGGAVVVPYTPQQVSGISQGIGGPNSIGYGPNGLGGIPSTGIMTFNQDNPSASDEPPF